MKKALLTPLVSDYVTILRAAAVSNNKERCMIGPSPELKKKLKADLNQLKRDLGSSVLSNLIKPLANTRLGFNDGVLQPGNVFAIGTSAAAVRTRSAEKAPLQGNLKVAVILVDFSDKPMTQPKKRFEDLFFSEGKIATGSVKEYYTEVTGGLVTISGQVAGPYRMPKKLSQYAHGESGTGSASPNARTLAADAAKAADADISFSSYDNNADGYVDAFVVIHAGAGAEVTGSKNDIWSHKWVLPGVYNADGTHIYGYLTVPEDCELGVCAHELGHLLFGFPDLYDSDYTSEGIGEWCLMAGGSWNNGGATPAHPCAWCKMQQNWVTTINQSTNKAKVVIDDVKTGKKIYRLWQDGGPGNEYFLAEHRMKKNFDKFIPGEGLVVYHIDDAIDDNSNEMHYKVAVVQADGKQDLEKGTNSGDGGDVWPGTAKKKTFSKTTKPNSKSYGGIDTKVAIKKIKLANAKITADLYVKAGAATVSKGKSAKKKK